MDELVYSGAGSGCREDDEDACVVPERGAGDDLITPVYVPSTRRPPKLHKVVPILFLSTKYLVLIAVHYVTKAFRMFSFFISKTQYTVLLPFDMIRHI